MNGQGPELDLREFPAQNRVAIAATDNRPNSGYYFVQVDPKTAKLLKLKRLAVVAFHHPAIAQASGLASREMGYIAIHARVQISSKQNPGVVGIDQTLRNALGIPFAVFKELSEMHLFLFPAERQWRDRFRDTAARFFGVRYLALRVQSADVTDIEKRYVRCPADVLKTLASQEADNLVIERPFPLRGPSGSLERFVIKSLRQSGYSASDRFLDNRQKLQTAFSTRYPNAQRDLYDYKFFHKAGYILDGKVAASGREIYEPDLPPIFMDFEARAAGMQEKGQGADFLTPVLVRRSIASTFGRDSIQAGLVTFGVSFFNVAFLLAGPGAPLTISRVVAAVGVSLFITLALLTFRLRQQV